MGLDLSVGRRVTSEYRQRTGHRFDMVVGCLPEGEGDAVTFEELLGELEGKGYLGRRDELAENLTLKRGEDSFKYGRRPGEALLGAAEGEARVPEEVGTHQTACHGAERGRH